jgi:hypothetical protein
MKILTLTPRKPIIYTPGIISLILLPMFCLVYLKQDKAFVHYSAIDIAVWSPDWNNRLPKRLQMEFPPVRNYLRINLDGNEIGDKARLDFARLEIRKMLASGDTKRGIDFHFWNTAKYQDFITAIDICQTENADIYIPYKNDIYVIVPKRMIFKRADYAGQPK